MLVWNYGTYRNNQFSLQNLGCFGDGGALITKDAKLAEKNPDDLQSWSKKEILSRNDRVNSRLDALQRAPSLMSS